MLRISPKAKQYGAMLRMSPKTSALVVSTASFCCAALAKLSALTGKTKFSLTSASLFSAALHPNQRQSEPAKLKPSATLRG